MPAVSRRQAGLIGLVAAGRLKLKSMTRDQAKEYLRGQSLKGLPETTTGRAKQFHTAVANRRRKRGGKH